jgi:uncharacterized membrane protein YkoI
MRLLATLTICAALVLGPLSANALSRQDPETGLAGQVVESNDTDDQVSQGNGGKSLSEAVEQVRRQTGGRILSAETKVQGNREVHHIKVLTKDGKVKTHKIQGRKRGD